MFLILQTDIYPVRAMRCKGTSFCISQPRLAIIEPSYNRVTKLELEFSARQNVRLDISMRVQNYKARNRESSSEQYTPLLHMENYLFYWTFWILQLCNVTAGWNGYTSSSWTDAWLTMQSKGEIRRQMFYCRYVMERAGHGVTQSHSPATLHFY